MPQTLSEIRAELEARGIRPKHRFGQNFLHDQNQLRRLVAASGVTAGDLVLEVGPGTGTLTETMLDAGCEVVACEIDRDMAAIVRARNAHRMGRAPGMLTVVEADCLDGKHAVGREVLRALDGRTFTLVANLPYQAATPLMATLLERHPECRGQFVTIQREVADRLMAGAGSDAYGPISVSMALLAHVEPVAVLGPGCFWPAPWWRCGRAPAHRRPSRGRSSPDSSSGCSGSGASSSGRSSAAPRWRPRASTPRGVRRRSGPVTGSRCGSAGSADRRTHAESAHGRAHRRAGGQRPATFATLAPAAGGAWS